MEPDFYQHLQRLAAQLRSDFLRCQSSIAAALAMLVVVMSSELFGQGIDSFWIVSFVYLASFVLVCHALNSLCGHILEKAGNVLLLCTCLYKAQQFFLEYVLCGIRLRVVRVVQSRILPPPLAPSYVLA